MALLVIICTLYLLLVIPSPGFAYIDPGTSGFVFSFLGPLLAMAAGFLGIFFKPVWRGLKGFFNWGKQRPLAFVGVLLVLNLILGAGIYYLFFFEEKPSGKPIMSVNSTKKIIVLGMDGLDARIIEKMMEAGDLPNFARLKGAGSYGRMESTNPSQSPVAWSSMATGCNPGKHGVYDFIKRDPKTYLPDLAILHFRKTAMGGEYEPVRRGRAFWELAAAQGIPSVAIRWPITFPPADNGAREFAGLGVPDIRGSLGDYTYYVTRQIPADEDGRHKVITVTPNGGVINTEVQGPPVASIGKPKRATVPLTIKMDTAQKQVTLETGGQSIVLKQGQWSNWVQFTFSLGFMRKGKAIGKFYLNEVNPSLGLYLTPLQIDPKEPALKFTNPEGFAPELAKEIGDYYTQGMPEDTKALTEGRFDEKAFMEQCGQVMQEREKMLMYELARFKGGVLAFVFDTSDRVQHMFWRFHEPELFHNDPAALEKYKNTIEDYYRLMDKLLGTIMGFVDQNTGIIVVSDHGFSSYRRSMHVNSWLVENGYMTLTNNTPDARKDNALFDGVDWSKTKAYALGFGSIYLNLQGREGKGSVSPQDAPRIRREIAEKLAQVKDPLDGKPAINKVYEAQEIYNGPYLSDAPDLVIGFNPGYRVSWQTAIGGSPAALFEDNTKAWSGDHCVDPSFVPAIVFSNLKLNTEKVRLIDIAPTVLDVMGIPIPPDVDGKSLLIKG